MPGLGQSKPNSLLLAAGGAAEAIGDAQHEADVVLAGASVTGHQVIEARVQSEVRRHADFRAATQSPRKPSVAHANIKGLAEHVRLAVDGHAVHAKQRVEVRIELAAAEADTRASNEGEVLL